MSDLFRPEVIERQVNRLHGEILILPRFRHTLILSLLLLWVFAAGYWLIANLNFVIRPGETTLIKCLMGLPQPTEGELLIDGEPINKLPYYHSQIAGIAQDDRLMSGSIADNIACFAYQVDLERVKTCARHACTHAETMSMPMQYNTLVGDMGSSLSGGQYQRLLLARALYRAPRILYLDEATSHLDLTNEAGINHHIKQHAVTRVIVAHRPETIALAGREISLDTTKVLQRANQRRS